MTFTIWFYMDSVPFSVKTIQGQTSLGGSESACQGTAEALAARGHDVKMFVSKLEQPVAVNGVDWVSSETMRDCLKFAPPDVFVSLRSLQPFLMSIPAKLVVLWNQDLMIKPHDVGIVSGLSQVDKMVYVSEYHKRQWCDLHPELEPLSWVTRNGIQPDYLPKRTSTRQPHRFLYLSRPERALEPLLQMWPRIRERWPDATLGIARYFSMYDGEGSNVAAMCQSYDQMAQLVQQDVGGIEMLGALGKRDLYRELSRSQLMLYPGVHDFAETGCIAVTEAQACGTPVVASWKGAIPEALHPDAGVLIDGDATTESYQEAFLEAVYELCDGPPQRLEEMGAAGRTWALPRYGFTEIAREWDEWLHDTFESRYRANRAGVLRQLLHWDRHAAAERVAEEIVRDGDALERREAEAALTLCARVIKQEDHTAADYANNALDDVSREMRHNRRLQVVAKDVANDRPSRVLDVSCGNGTFAALVANAVPGCHIDGYDLSEGVIDLARREAKRLGFDEQTTFAVSDYQKIPVTEPYDMVFCGEFLEHIEKPWLLLDQLERYVKPGGRIILTTPCGPFAEVLEMGMEHKRGHVHAFSVQDIATMCRGKTGFKWRYLDEGVTRRGSSVGYWIISYEPGGEPAYPLDYEALIHTTRPYQRLVASMIVKDGADWLRKCLKSLWGIVDRVVIYDTGSTDGSQDIARQCGAEVVQGDWPESFAVARNRALDLVERDAEWILWIDADEQLMNSLTLRRFITGAGPFNAYVLRQVHMAIDQDTYDDKPQRLFRTGCGVRFFGDVHEQPEQEPDRGILPALDFSDRNAPRIMHWGYYEESVRRDKLAGRNLELLKKELSSDHPRELTYVLAIRDYCNLALFDVEEHRRLTPFARRYYEKAIDLFKERFADPTHQYHQIATPYYYSALQALRRGVTAKWAFAATPGVTMRGDVQPQQIWAESAEELERMTSGQIHQWVQPLRPFVPDTTPVKTRQGDQWSVVRHEHTVEVASC